MKIVIKDVGCLDEHISISFNDSSFNLLKVLPSNSEGKLLVSHDNENYIFVSPPNIFKYPYLKINTYKDGIFLGVSEQGIALLAFEIKKSDITIDINTIPTFITAYKDKVQVVYKLKNYINYKNESGTYNEDFMEWLENTISMLESDLSATYTDIIINPMCDKVTTHLFNINSDSEVKGSEKKKRYIGVHLEDFYKPDEKIALHKRNQKILGGKHAALVKKNKTIAKIDAAIKALKAAGKPINQVIVADWCGVTRQTVSRHRHLFDELHI